jgi:hypothetical protein
MCAAQLSLWTCAICAVCLARDSVTIGTGHAWTFLGRSIWHWGQAMQPGAVWIIYTLMFGYPVPTHDEHEFTNRAACEIHKHSYSEQIVEAFQLVCSTK